MARAFAEIAFTDSVRAAQRRYGSLVATEALAIEAGRQDTLTDVERQFIERMDGFFQATVSESGWPYVQFRGGPPGFLKVLDERLIGFADLRGNVQYLSVGNLDHDGRIALILLDHARRRRLKLWGRARVVDFESDPVLVRSLVVPNHEAHVERGILIEVEAFDWNCPRHISPRFTEGEILEMTRPLLAELESLRGTIREPARSIELGVGELRLKVTGARVLTPRVRAYELRAADGQPLPEIGAGAHLSVPVSMDPVQDSTRHYSIASDPDDPMRWEIAVLREPQGSRGASFIHEHYALGSTLGCRAPRNGFPLHEDNRPTVLIAGGIGIAPLKAMAHVLRREQRWFELHYAAKSSVEAPYVCELQQAFPDNLHTYWSSHGPDARLDLEKTVRSAPAGSIFYVCGPARMIDEMKAVANRLSLQEGQVCFERFSAPAGMASDRPFEVRIRHHAKSMIVPAGKSILEVLLEAGEHPNHDCRTGTCGTCAVRVLEGEPDHRDMVLTTAERSREKLMCTCVSRCRGDLLVLDL